MAGRGMNAAIEASGVSAVFDHRAGRFGTRRHVIAVDDVSLTVEAGVALGIVGESGCGKSTLARLLLGLLAPSGGSVRVDGQALLAMDRRARARLIQPVFQDPASSLNPRRRVCDIVALPLRAAGVGSAERRERALSMLARVGLAAAPARGDRAGAGAGAAHPDLRRADLGARRFGAGADPEPAGGAARELQPDAGDDQPQPRGGGARGR
jgi:peptide/nickel transport system ATP-binding protein